jgi:phosphatidylserine/phosphatidylglycerophosphate/cardiolipin synthase-like enzyme
MLEQPSSSADALAHLVAGSTPAAISALVKGLTGGSISLDSSSVGIDALPGVTSETAQRATLAFTKVKGVLDEGTVAFALDMGNALRQIERLDRPEVELVWTGPGAAGPLVRQTAEVVEEMIRGVRKAGELLIVGYSLTAQDGSLMHGVVELLGDASKRRAAITIILHRDEGQLNRRNLLAAWDVLAKRPRVLTWDPPKDHPYTKLHAKALVVDRLDALVTSANLTLHGMEANLELGLRVRGPQAGAIAERFDHLIATGVLKEWVD